MSGPPRTPPATPRDRPPRHLMAIVHDLPAATGQQVRAELWRANRRSRRFWAAVLILAATPALAVWTANQLPLRSPAHRQMASGAAAVVGTLGALLVFMRLTTPILDRHLRAIFNTHHLCTTCGYDCRATPERCPECGTIPTA